MSDPEPDGERSPFRTYRLALERTPANATHRLILQDDTRPVTSFYERALDALAEHPDALVAFYLGGSRPDYRMAARKIYDAGGRWLRLWDMGHIPVVALCWPRAHIERFFDWLPEYRFQPPRIDDGVVASYCKRQRPKPKVWATVPSLVQHEDIVGSLMGKVARQGGNRGRVAALFVDD